MLTDYVMRIQFPSLTTNPASTNFGFPSHRRLSSADEK